MLMLTSLYMCCALRARKITISITHILQFYLHKSEDV